MNPSIRYIATHSKPQTMRSLAVCDFVEERTADARRRIEIH